MNRLQVAALAFAFILPGIAFGQPLEWKLEEDDQFTARLIQETEVATTGGFESKQNLLYDLSTDWRVTAVGAKKVSTVQITIKSIRVKIDNSVAPGFAVDVDTGGEAPTSDPSKTFSKHMHSLVGKKFLMQLTTTGKVKHLPHPAETKKTIDGFPKTDYVLQTFHIESVVQSMTAYFTEFPRDLAVGKSWKTHSGTNAPVNESFVSTTTYAGPIEIEKKKLAKFTFKTEPKSAGDRKVSKEGREPFVISKQTGQGSSLFDPDSGNFTKSEHHNEVHSTTEFEGVESGTRITTDFRFTMERVAVP